MWIEVIRGLRSLITVHCVESLVCTDFTSQREQLEDLVLILERILYIESWSKK